MLEGYAPGFSDDALSMMSARTASERAQFAIRLLRPGACVLDVGCGPGTITRGFLPYVGEGRVLGVDRARRQFPAESTVDLVAGSAYGLPVAGDRVDVVFAHGLFEHLSRPADALREMRRVLRPGGALALSTSDWSHARIRPRTANVTAALRGHYLLRRRAGGDPFAGGRLADLVAAAGFREVTARPRYRPDMSYRDLARYVESRLDAALRTAPDVQLASAARSAWAWSHGRDGDFTQCWVELVAVK